MVPLRVKIYAALLTFFLALLLSADVPIWGDAFQTCDTARALIERGVLQFIPLSKLSAGDGLAYTKYGLVYVLSCVPSVLAEKLVGKVTPQTPSAQKLSLSLTPAVILALFMVVPPARCRLCTTTILARGVSLCDSVFHPTLGK